MRIAAYHLPTRIAGCETESMSRGEVSLEVPRVSPQLLADVIAQLMRARERLCKRKASEIAEALSATATRWRERTDPMRQIAEGVLPAVTGFSPAMVAHGLDLVWARYDGEAFHGMLERAGDPEALDEFVRLGPHKNRVYGPALTTHVLAGNIPGVGLPGLIAAVMVGSASLVKPAAADPLFVALWARSVAGQDPEIGDSLAVLWWAGGRTDLEAVAFDRADAVIAYGSDETIHALRARVRCRFIGHGHRISFGVVGREVLVEAEAVADRAAYDTSLFDQQGCLSPHLFYVEVGGRATPREFAGLLAAAMERWAKRLPPGSPTREEALAVRRFRADYEAREVAGKDVGLFTSPERLAWTVIYDADPVFAPSCLHRTVLVKPVADLAEVNDHIGSHHAYLQAAGVAVGRERMDMVAARLGRAGVSRICPIGTMQTPPLTWHQEGRNLFHDLLRWVDLET